MLLFACHLDFKALSDETGQAAVAPPQVAEQVDQEAQADIWQLTGHGCVLQD